VALPIVLFAGAVAVGQAYSPAKGQSLLPTLPSGIVTVSLGEGHEAEVYWEPGTAGVNSFHLFFLSSGLAGGSVAASGVVVTASHNGGPAVGVRTVRQSVGHYLGYVVLTPGRWTYHVAAAVAGKPVSFSVAHRVS
jgi:hypothetical protein